MGSIEIHPAPGNPDDKINKAIEKALTMAGGVIESAAKEILTANGSVDTGLLRNSITYALGGEYPATQQYGNNAGGTDKSGKKITEQKGTYDATAPADTGTERTVYVGTNVEYAPYVELGTNNGKHKTKAKPYLRPAAETSREKIKKAFEVAFRNL